MAESHRSTPGFASGGPVPAGMTNYVPPAGGMGDFEVHPIGTAERLKRADELEQALRDLDEAQGRVRRLVERATDDWVQRRKGQANG